MRRTRRPIALVLSTWIALALASRAGTDCDDVATRQEALLSAKQRATIATRVRDFSSASRDLSAFLIFVGYSRSGHTLLGALLDGHPQMAIANEFNVVGRSFATNSTRGLLPELALNAAVCSVYGRTQAGFNYSLGGALIWQGRWCSESQRDMCEHGALRVIGDKRGGGTSQILERLGPDAAVSRLLAYSRGLSLPLRVLHVLRSPYDMGATQFLTHGSEGDWHAAAATAESRDHYNRTGRDWTSLHACEVSHLVRTADFYGRLIVANAVLRSSVRTAGGCTCAFGGSDIASSLAEVHACLRGASCSDQKTPSIGWLDLQTETFQRQPAEHLRVICAFLGLGCPTEYVTAAAGAVRASRHETSSLLRWPRNVTEAVTARLDVAGHSEPSWRPLLDAYARGPAHVVDAPDDAATRIPLTRATPSCGSKSPMKSPSRDSL